MAADRLAQGAARLHARLAARCGAAVVYARGGVAVELTAVAPTDRAALTQPGGVPLRAAQRDRDFVVDAAALAAAGLFPPQAGDTLTAGGAEYTVSPRATMPDRPVWEWGETDRVTVRLFCSERGEPFVRLPVDWDDGTDLAADDGSPVLWG